MIGYDERRETVMWAYRLFLGREPENQAVVDQFLGLSDVNAIREAFMRSEEFVDVFDASPRGDVRTFIPSKRMRIDVRVTDKDFVALLDHVRKVWTSLGERAPHWSVLSAEEFKPENISKNEDTFYASGAADVRLILDILQNLAIEKNMIKKVFEYGCGLGRVTAFLAKIFDHVVACDISSSHLRKAKQNLVKERITNVKFVLASNNCFGMEDSFDLWISRIVLQHNPPPVTRAILELALDKLTSNGIAIFQVPTYHESYNFDFDEYIKHNHDNHDIEMHCFPQQEVFRLAREGRCDLLEVSEDNDVGIAGWRSNTFVLQKRG